MATGAGQPQHPGTTGGDAVAYPTKFVVGLGVFRIDMGMARRLFPSTVLLIFLAVFTSACGAATPASPGSSPTGSPGKPVATPQPASPTLVATLAPTQAPTLQPAIPEARVLFMEWPPTIRVGDSRRIHLTLQVDAEGRLTPTVSEEGNVTRGEPLQIPNLYETHNVVVEARFDIAGVQVSPEGEIMEPMQPGQTVNFYWSVKPQDVGTYQGTIWIHLHFIPLQGGTDSRIALTAQPVEVKAINFLGLGGTPARILGGAGALLGSVLGLDNLLSWIWGLLKRKAAAQVSGLKGGD